MAAIEAQQGYVAAFVAAYSAPNAKTPELDQALDSLVEGAGFVWQKLRGLQDDLTSTRQRSHESLDAAIERFASWPQLLEQVIAQHAPPSAPQLTQPVPVYPDAAAIPTPELDALERDLADQTAARTPIEQAIRHHAEAATSLIAAARELHRSLLP